METVADRSIDPVSAFYVIDGQTGVAERSIGSQFAI
jgi:hypothetical protein